MVAQAWSRKRRLGWPSPSVIVCPSSSSNLTAVFLDARHAGHLPVHQPRVPVVAGEPHPVAGAQFEAARAVRLHAARAAGDLPGPPPDLAAGGILDNHRPTLPVDTGHGSAVALLHPQPLVPAVEDQRVAFGVAGMQIRLRAGQAPGQELLAPMRAGPWILALGQEPVPDDTIDRVAQRAGGRDDTGIVPASLSESVSHRCAASFASLSRSISVTLFPSFLNAALISPSSVDLTADFSLESFCRRISSSTAVCMPDFINCPKGFPASTPSSCFSSPDQHDPGQSHGRGGLEQIPHLFGGGQRSLVHHQNGLVHLRPQPFQSLRGHSSLDQPGLPSQEPLQGLGGDARFLPQRFGRRCRRGQALQRVAVAR